MLSIQKEKLLSAQNIISSEKMSLKNGSIKNFYTADEGKQTFGRVIKMLAKQWEKHNLLN